MTAPPSDTPSNRGRKGGHWLHLTIVLFVFGITGIFTAAFSRQLLGSVLHLDGSIWSGPWSYRAAYVLLSPPSYTAILLLVGTLFGKHRYFKRRILRLWGWALPRRVYARAMSGER